MRNLYTNSNARWRSWTAQQKGIIAFLGVALLCLLVSFFLLIYGDHRFLSNLVATNTPTLILNPTLAALPASAISTVTPGPLHDPVCASYFQQQQSTDFIQGTWTNDSSVAKIG
jgi:uncharacterized membrane protein (DUF485 family)